MDARDRRRGFSQVGYHEVIERDGESVLGRMMSQASVYDDLYIAKDSYSICLIGSPGNFTITQQDTLAEIIPAMQISSVLSSIRDVTTENLIRWINKQLSNEWLRTNHDNSEKPL